MERPKKILIIEDDPDLGAMIKRLLVSQGYDSYFAKNGSSGIERAFELKPNLILCDIQMKPIDGYQVYNILSESSLTSQIPFVFITGKSELEDIRFGLELGADDYLVKPFSNEDLLKTIQTRIKKHESLLNVGKSEFEALMELSPYGIFISEGLNIINANTTFKKSFGIEDLSASSVTLDKILDNESFTKLEGTLTKCFNSIVDCYNGEVVVNKSNGALHKMNLSMSSTLKYSGSRQVLGIFTPIVSQSGNGQASVNLDTIYKVLKEEEVTLTENLTSKLGLVFSKANVQPEESDISFSRRETEVLKLSCDGLPIKLIADKLCISDRTVEKYRASLMSKTKSKNIVEVLIYALKNNIVQI